MSPDGPVPEFLRKEMHTTAPPAGQVHIGGQRLRCTRRCAKSERLRNRISRKPASVHHGIVFVDNRN